MSFVFFLYFSLILFLIGLIGVGLNRKNVLLTIMSIELVLLAVNINIITSSVFLDDLTGQIFSLFILIIAAAESSIGLAILICYYRIRGDISIEYINFLKG